MSIHIFNENDLINYTAHSAPASGDIVSKKPPSIRKRSSNEPK